jgi:hypothetical protein
MLGVDRPASGVPPLAVSGSEEVSMTPDAAPASRRGARGGSIRPRAPVATARVRGSAGLLIAALVAGPVATHVYWLLGGTWGLHRAGGGAPDGSTSAGIRVVAAVVVLLLVGAVLVVLARAGLWRQAFVPDRVIRFLAWALAAVFLLEAVASLTWSRDDEWWLYGPASLVIGLLALRVAASSDARPRPLRPHRTPASHRKETSW